MNDRHRFTTGPYLPPFTPGRQNEAMLTPAFRMFMRALGVGCVALAGVLSVASLVSYGTGYEPAFLGMILALGLFATGIGALAVGRE